MPDHVRERLLHDPVGGHVGAGREPPPLTGEGELDVDSGGANTLDERVEAVEAGRRIE